MSGEKDVFEEIGKKGKWKRGWGKKGEKNEEKSKGGTRKKKEEE